MLKIMITCRAAAVRPRVRLDLFLLQPKFLISMATFRCVYVATHIVVFSTVTNLELGVNRREFITDFNSCYIECAL